MHKQRTLNDRQRPVTIALPEQQMSAYILTTKIHNTDTAAFTDNRIQTCERWHGCQALLPAGHREGSQQDVCVPHHHAQTVLVPAHTHMVAQVIEQTNRKLINGDADELKETKS